MRVFLLSLLVLCIILTSTFVIRYGLRAPWWNSFEGVGLFSLMTSFDLFLINLFGRLVFVWEGYDEVLVFLLISASAVMAHQNILLHRAQKKITRAHHLPKRTSE